MKLENGVLIITGLRCAQPDDQGCAFTDVTSQRFYITNDVLAHIAVEAFECVKRQRKRRKKNENGVKEKRRKITLTDIRDELCDCPPF